MKNIGKIFKFIAAKMIDMLGIIICMQIIPPFIYQSIFKQDFNKYQSLVQQAKTNEQLAHELITQPLYFDFMNSVVICLVLCLLVFIIIPIIINKRSLGEIVLNITTLKNKTISRLITLQPSLWLILGIFVPYVFVIFQLQLPPSFISFFKFCFYTLSLFCFIINFNEYNNIKMYNQPQQDYVPTQHRVINKKPKVKNHTNKHKKH